jgi:tetratricopeptide (TPR) repeat protein
LVLAFSITGWGKMTEPEDRHHKLGELLVAAGLVPEERLSEGLEYARRNSLPLGRVLITLKILSQEDLESVLHSQALMKMDRLPARLAVKALSMASSTNMSIDRALKKLGWFSESYVEGEAVSIAVAREQLSNCESSFGSDHPETAAACLKLAELLSDNRSYLDAELLYNRAAKIVEECFGQQSLEMARLLSEMGGHYFAQDLFSEAEKYYWQAYDINLTLLGDRNLAVAQCLEDLADLYDVQSEYLQAERLYLSSIGIKEKLLEADDPELLSSLRKLVLICRQSCDYAPETRPTGELLVDAGMVEQSKIDEGLQLAKKYNVPLGRALITLKQLSQEDLQKTLHAQLLMKDGGIPGYVVVRALKTACRMNLTIEDALKKVGWKREQPADRHQFEALLRCSDELIKLEQKYTPEHPDVGKKCVELADLYAAGNNLRESEILLKRALNIYLDHYGEDDLVTAATLSNLAQVHCRQARWDEANHMMERTVNLSRKRSPKGSHELADYLEKQARILNASGKTKEALLKISELLSLARKLERGDTAYVSQVLELQGDVFMSQEQLEQALKVYSQSLSIREKVVTGANPQISSLLNKIGEIELKQGNFEAALKHFQKSLTVSKKVLGSNHPVLALAELNIAGCHAGMKNHVEARKSYEQAVKIMERTAGENHDGTASVLEQFAAYLKTTGQDEEAAEMDKRIQAIRSNPDSRSTAINLKVLH